MSPKSSVAAMKAPDFTSLTDKSFENKFNHERESKGPVMPISVIPAGFPN